MLPWVCQVLDRHPEDFTVPLWRTLWQQWRRWQGRSRPIQNYVCELQRQAAIGYFCLWLDSHAQQPHPVDLTVHPYQPEREACFRWAGAVPQGVTLWLARSVWHKLREVKVNLQELSNLAVFLPQFQLVPVTLWDLLAGEQNMAQ